MGSQKNRDVVDFDHFLPVNKVGLVWVVGLVELVGIVTVVMPNTSSGTCRRPSAVKNFFHRRLTQTDRRQLKDLN